MRGRTTIGEKTPEVVNVGASAGCELIAAEIKPFHLYACDPTLRAWSELLPMTCNPMTCEEKIVLRSVHVFLALGLAVLAGGCAANPEMSLLDTFETSAAAPVAGQETGQNAEQDFGQVSDQVMGSDTPADLVENGQSAEIARGSPTGLIDREDRNATLLYLRSLSQSARGSSTRRLSTSTAELQRLQATHAEKALSEIEGGS